MIPPPPESRSREAQDRMLTGIYLGQGRARGAKYNSGSDRRQCSRTLVCLLVPLWREVLFGEVRLALRQNGISCRLQCHHPTWVLVQILATPLSICLLANVSGKVAEGGPGWGFGTHVADPGGAPGPWHWPAQPSPAFEAFWGMNTG